MHWTASAFARSFVVSVLPAPAGPRALSAKVQRSRESHVTIVGKRRDNKFNELPRYSYLWGSTCSLDARCFSSFPW